VRRRRHRYPHAQRGSGFWKFFCGGTSAAEDHRCRCKPPPAGPNSWFRPVSWSPFRLDFMLTSVTISSVVVGPLDVFLGNNSSTLLVPAAYRHGVCETPWDARGAKDAAITRCPVAHHQISPPFFLQTASSSWRFGFPALLRGWVSPRCCSKEKILWSNRAVTRRRIIG
jgi:hypothetical protein